VPEVRLEDVGRLNVIVACVFVEILDESLEFL